MGLLETAKMNGLGASLLTDELKRLPGWPEESQDELLPIPPYGVSE
ncbi:transposase domain-containing protein [Salmonella enterica]|nr:transposase domain-containing protein [Salmonella enterica]EDY3377883.1 transposase domain-containing protein [Salmonella enterica]EHL5407796.1 transposase domain-containing protein [Salmonella enterica]ELH4157775.1 transposase domain-containing protein [Salmonella enterica]HAU3151337.1 transposase domain-containing protein [Salmonella enterica subsp. diarizonae]